MIRKKQPQYGYCIIENIADNDVIIKIIAAKFIFEFSLILNREIFRIFNKTKITQRIKLFISSNFVNIFTIVGFRDDYMKTFNFSWPHLVVGCVIGTDYVTSLG